MRKVKRVLIAHSEYRSGFASGENRVVRDEIDLLKASGVEVESYLIPSETLPSGVRGGMHVVWPRKQAEQFGSLLTQVKPDVVHFHNLFPALSPLLVREAAAQGCRTVMTLHNYRLLCLPATFLRDGKACEKCLGKLPWRGVVYRCYQGSTVKSGALALSLATHSLLRTFEAIDGFVAVSEFVRDKHVEAGFSESRISVKPNFSIPAGRRKGPGDYFLYAGRLSPEKDLATVIRATEGLETKLEIVGEGPDENRLRELAPDNVRFRGTVSPSEVQTLIEGAKALVLPALSYEGCPRGVLEAYASGVPVVSNRIGAVPEFVLHEKTGLLATPADVSEWRGALRRLEDTETSLELGAGAFQQWEEKFSPKKNADKLLDIYESLL